MTKFLHTSDWHLGMQAHFLPPEARARYTRDRFDAVAQIAGMATSNACEFVVVAGDVFDSNHVSDAAVLNALEALREFTVPVYLLPGNHDCFDPGSVYRSRIWQERRPEHVIVLTGHEPVQPLAGVQVIGAPILGKNAIGDPLTSVYRLGAKPGDTTRVIVGHGMLDSLNPDAAAADQLDSNAILRSLASGVADYVALGDRHSATVLDGSDGRCRYSGTPLVTRYDEIDAGKVLLVELTDRGCDVLELPVGEWQFRIMTFDLAGIDDVRILEQALDAVEHKSRTAVRLALRGALSLSEHAELDRVLHDAQNLFAALNRWESHSDLVVSPTEQDLLTLELSGYARAALLDLRGDAGSESPTAGVSRDALNLLFRLAR